MSKFTKVLLIIIFIISIGLIGHIIAGIFGFPGVFYDKPDKESAEASEYDIKRFAAPAYMIAGAGSYEYKYTEYDAVVNDEAVIAGAEDAEVYSSFTAGLKEFFSFDGIEVKDVTESITGGYGEILTKGSIMALFEYNIPLNEYLEFIGVEKKDTVNEIKYFSDIALLSDGSLFVHDGIDKKYYMLNIQSDSGDIKNYSDRIQMLINSVNDQSGYTMQSVSRLTGVENDTAIPVGISLNIVSAEFAMEMSGADSASKMKPVFFPDGSEFVKKIDSNDGANIWMYGTGKKVLRIDGSGVVEYHEKLDPSEYEHTSYYRSLKTAAGYINTHGGWPEVEGTSFFVRSVKEIEESDCSGYYIEFGVKVNGTEVMYGGKEIISVEVFGDRVVSYSRRMPDLERIKNAVSGEPVQAADLQEIIRSYSAVIADTIIKKHGNDSNVNIEKYMTEDKYYAVNSGIKDAHVVFVKNGKKAENSEEILIEFTPAWYVNVDGIGFWFDAATGEMLDPLS